MAYITKVDLTSLGYTFTSEDEAPLAQICQRASDMADSFVMKPLGKQSTDSEFGTVRVKSGQFKFFPEVKPVISVAYINIESRGTTYGTTDLKPVNNHGYVQGSTNLPDGEYLAEISYDHGYDSIPSDVKNAVVLIAGPLVDDYMLAKQTEIGGAERIKEGNMEIQRTNTDEIPKDAKDLLNNYKRVV